MAEHQSSNFSVTIGSNQPIYRQLIEQVQWMIASGRLAPGDTLPSVRSIAYQFAINPMTVSKAYQQLESAGLLIRNRGKGMRVSQAGSAIYADPDKREELLMPAIQNAANASDQLAIRPSKAARLFIFALRRLQR